MIQKKVTDFFALEGNYPDLDGEGAAARLSALKALMKVQPEGWIK